MTAFKTVAATVNSLADAAGTDGQTQCDIMMRGVRQAITLRKNTVDSAASDVTSYYEVTADEQSDATYLPYGFTVTNAKIIPFDTLTAHDTNNATITVAYDAGGGGAQTAIASLTTNVASGNWAVGTNKTMTVAGSPAGAVNVPADSNIVFTITKANAGVAVPMMRIVLYGKLT